MVFWEICSGKRRLEMSTFSVKDGFFYILIQGAGTEKDGGYTDLYNNTLQT